MQETVGCQCVCHTYHLIKCGDCKYSHYLTDEDLSFTDSHIIDCIAEYFHQFGLPEEKQCTFYYPCIKECAFLNKEMVFSSEYLRFLDFLFVGKTEQRTKELFHKGIVSYIGKYDGMNTARGLDAEGQTKWRIENA